MGIMDGTDADFMEECDRRDKQPSAAGSATQLASTTITMFLTFIQTKGAWPCIMEIGEAPKQIPPDEVFKLRDEFISSL